MTEDQIEEDMALRGTMNSDDEFAALGRENETYAKLQLADVGNGAQIIYVKGTWYPTHFLMSVMDGYDTWVCNATQEFVAHEASRWGIEVVEWLDRMHAHFSQHHLQSKYAFMSVDPDVKMLECSFLDEMMEERLLVKLEFHKTTSCGSMAYDLLELLVDTNTKQYEELAQKTRDIQRLAAEIRRLRYDLKEYGTHSVGDQSVMNYQQSEQHVESNSVKNEPFEENHSSTNQNTNYFNENEESSSHYQDQNNEQSSSHYQDQNNEQSLSHYQDQDNEPSSSQYQDQNNDSLMDNSWNEEQNLRQQMFHDHNFVSNDGVVLNDNDIENSQYDPIESPQIFKEENIEEDQLQSQNKEHETVNFHHNSSNEDEQQIVHTCSKHSELDWNHNSKNISVVIAPMKITIHKKFVVDVDFKEQLSFFKSSYNEVQQSIKTNWDSNLLPTQHDLPPHSDQYLLPPTVEQHVEPNNEFDNDIMIEEEPQDEDVSFEIAPPFNFDRAKKRGSKVNFIPAPQEDEPKKTYYKTPKHSYVKSKMDASGYGTDEEIEYEIPSSRSKSYVSNGNSSNSKHSHRARKSAPCQYHLQESNLSNPTPKKEKSHKNNNNKSAKSAKFNLQNNTYSEIKNDLYESELDYKDSYDKSPHNNENESNNGAYIQPPIQSILNHGPHNKQKEHIVWGENSSSDVPSQTNDACVQDTKFRQSYVANTQQPHLSNPSTSTYELQESMPSTSIANNTSISQNMSNESSQFQGNAQKIEFKHYDEEDLWKNYSTTNIQASKKKPSKSYVSPTTCQTKNKSAKSFVGKIASFFQKPSNKNNLEDSFKNEIVIESSDTNINKNGYEEHMSTNDTNGVNYYKSYGALSYKDPKKNNSEKSIRSMSYAHSLGSKAPKESKPSFVQSIKALFQDAPSNSEKNNNTWEASTLTTDYKPMPTQTQLLSTIQNNEKELSHQYVDLQQSNQKTSAGNQIGNELIDDHQLMDSSKRASIEEVRRELSFKLGKQLEAQEQESMYTPKVQYEKKTHVTHVRGRDDEPRRYSIDKIGADLAQLKQKTQSSSESRESVYSNFLKAPSKSVGALHFGPKFKGGNEYDDGVDFEAGSHSMNQRL
ncbi:uncharacterized protein [Physcomitrium patens]|uniref:uncharacterized protein isoform X2 n=1 Tax=Physcomitrium patens TaxID=3218 RepID=UPI003CCD54CE